MIELHWGRDHREPSRCRRIGQSSQHPPGLDIIVLGTGPGRARLIVIWPRAVGTTTRGKHPDREELMTERPATPPRVRRTATTLADGRELIYFDDSEPYLSGAQSRTVVDERPLHDRPTAGMMRQDALTGDWVSIADHRQNRTFLPPTDECPSVPERRRHDAVGDPGP